MQTELTTPNYAAAPPAKRRRRWPYVLLGLGLAVVLGVVALAALAGTAANEIGNAIEEVEADQAAADAAATIDVGPAQCEQREGGYYAAGTLTNGSAERSDYTIEARGVDAGGTLIANGTAFVPNVDPGQSAPWSTLLELADMPAGVRCEVVDVTRWASR
jgi:hypothetical protein